MSNHPMGVHKTKGAWTLFSFAEYSSYQYMTILFHLITFNIIIQIVENSIFIKLLCCYCSIVVVTLLVCRRCCHRSYLQNYVLKAYFLDFVFCFWGCTPSLQTPLTLSRKMLDVTPESRQVLSQHHHQCCVDKVVAIIDVDEFVQKNVVPSTVVVDIIMTSYELSVDVPTLCRVIRKLPVCLRHDVCCCLL